MSEAGRRRLDHVVLPRRSPGLALLERYYPSPADNAIDAELDAFAGRGDTILDPWAGTGWTARRAIARRLRAVAADPSPFAQLAARALLLAPDPTVLDAAFAQLAASRRVDVPLRQHVEELYATHCATCRRPVVGEQFIWPREGDAPGRKVYRCAGCDLSVGGPPERVSPVDEHDLAKLGIEPGQREVGLPGIEPDPDPEDLPAAPVGLSGPPPDTDPEEPPLGEPGGPPPPPMQADPPTGHAATGQPSRWASTVRPETAPQAQPADLRQGIAYQQLRDRFPVLDGRHELVEELLALYTPRNLYALQVIAGKIEAEFRDAPAGSVLRLALAACLLPASRLNGYPGRVASLRISNGHIREPTSRHQREVNVWRLFEAAFGDVRTAIAALGSDRPVPRFAADFGELGGMGASNLFWIRARPAVVGQYLPPESVDFVIGTPGRPVGLDELSFEYLATAWLLGREAAETLRLEPLFGPAADRTDVGEEAAIRHALSSAAGALRPGGWCSLLLEGDDPDRAISAAVAAAEAGLELVDVIPRESGRVGDGVTLHLRKASAEDRLRAAVKPGPLRLGVEDGHLTYPELASAFEEGVGALLRDRGEPARIGRITAAVLVELQRRGLLRRLAQARGGEGNGEQNGNRGERGAALLSTLLREELLRTDHPAVVRVDEAEGPRWWLRQPSLAEAPLADRVEWATFSILSTAGRIDELSFFDRIYRLFPGIASPDEELVRAALHAYAVIDEHGWLHPRDDLAERLADHTRILGLLAALGHRLGCRVWISRREQPRAFAGGTLADLLEEQERRVYLPLVVRGAGDALSAVDALWYVRGKFAFLFEVEWTAMVGEPVLRRGREITPGDDQVRLLVVPAERTELLRLKLERSPWLRAEVERQNWHFLKWQHLEALAARDPSPTLERLEPILGLDPLVERGGQQLTMFGE